MSATKKSKSNLNPTTEKHDFAKDAITSQEKDAQLEIDGPIVPEPFFENWRNTPPLTGQARLDAFEKMMDEVASHAHDYPEGYEIDMSRD